MFTLPGLIAIFIAHATKVHEISGWLRPLPVIHLLYLIGCVGLMLDIRLGIVRTETSPQFRIALPLWGWSILSALLAGSTLPQEISGTMVYMLIFLLIAQGVQSFRALRVVAVVLLGITVFLIAVVFVQRQNPFECQLLVATEPGDSAARSDGRPCETAGECRRGAEPGEDYLCERSGPFSTTSVGHGRVRYRGFLEDPNELALMLVMALPLVMISSGRRRSVLKVVLIVLLVAASLPVVVWTASRTGQFAFVIVVGIYLMQRLGWKGLIVAALVAAPALLLGGRSGDEADESTLERLEAWSVGLDLFKSSPVWGIGRGLFSDHHYLTAHNTFVLETAELGFVGFMLWNSLVYSGLKIAVAGIRRYRDRPDGALACDWARALLATFSGLVVGMTFLSLAYHPIMWIFLGLPSAYYLTVRRHDPDFRVVFGRRDLIRILAFSVVFLIGLRIYLSIKGA